MDDTSHHSLAPPVEPTAAPAVSARRGMAERPGIYALLVLCALLAAFAYKLRTQGVFACPAAGADGDHYVAYCNATAYGDYDRGAFRFALESRVREAAADADVLFLGSSRMQFALSAQATVDWFARARAGHFLLGFSHTENVVFIAPLLADLKPRARAYVINVDRFFDDRVTAPTHEILHDKDVLSHYREKRFWQSLQRPLCSAWSALCGSELTFVRFRQDGHWELRGSTSRLKATGIGDGVARDREKWDRYIDIARRFVASIPVDRRCVILTIAPSEETMIDEARAIATALGLPLVSPRPDGLRTFDSSHLDRASAERWSAAFLGAVGSQISDCLGRPAGA
jgi:hypothetical protein